MFTKTKTEKNGILSYIWPPRKPMMDNFVDLGITFRYLGWKVNRILLPCGIGMHHKTKQNIRKLGLPEVPNIPDGMQRHVDSLWWESFVVQHTKPLDDKYSPSHQPAWYSAKPKKLMYLKYGYSFHFAKKFGNTVHTSKRKNYLGFVYSSGPFGQAAWCWRSSREDISNGLILTLTHAREFGMNSLHK